MGPMRGFMGLNGGLDALIATVKRFWIIGVGLMVAVTWIFSVNQGVRHQSIIEKKLDDQSVAVAEVAVRQVHMEKFEHDSLVSVSDMNFLMGQSLAAHRKFDNRLRALERRPIQEGIGRWEYFPEYGSVPEKYRLWFEPKTTTQWLEDKADGR